MDCESGRVGEVIASALSPLSWLALSTEFGRLPFRERPSAPLTVAEPGRSTRREIRSSSSALLSERLGTGETTYSSHVSIIGSVSNVTRLSATVHTSEASPVLARD